MHIKKINESMNDLIIAAKLLDYVYRFTNSDYVYIEELKDVAPNVIQHFFINNEASFIFNIFLNDKNHLSQIQLSKVSRGKSYFLAEFMEATDSDLDYTINILKSQL